ncbi:MAG TPA: hypothetical protein VGF34_13565 [Stellaceae bacterium]|jgi:hypothetical protein
MIIRDLATVEAGGETIHSAVVVWEDQNHPEQMLSFATGATVDIEASAACAEPCTDAFLTACFPLAAVHGEARVKIDGRPCPMLIEGLKTAYAWWESWGGMPAPAPAIETAARGSVAPLTGSRHAVAFLSGGVDGLHVLMHNRRIYRPDDPAYIREALFIHGFDIGKRSRNPENERYQMALRRLEPIAAETGLHLVPCRTNLRHFPSVPGFWEYRYNGAALAAVGHAAIARPAFLFIGASHDPANPVPWGSHPMLDPMFSSQRLRIIHEGSRFSRLDKVRELSRWGTALASLRVCSENVGNRANCGGCEKCLRTRLELLAADVQETSAFGPSLPPEELWEHIVPKPIGGRAAVYEELLPALRARGHLSLCRVIEERIARFSQEKELNFVGLARDGGKHRLDDPPNRSHNAPWSID